MKHLTIRTRIVAWFVALVSVLLVLSGATIYTLTSRELRDSLDGDISRWATTIASRCEFESGGLYFDLEQDVLARLSATGPTVEFAVYSYPDLEVAARWHRNDSAPPPWTPSDLLARIRAIDVKDPPDVAIWTDASGAGGERVRVRAAVMKGRPIDDPEDEPDLPPEGPTVLIAVAMGTAGVEATLQHLLVGIGVVSPLLLVAATLAGWLLSRRIVNPIAAIAEAAARIRDTDPSKSVPRPAANDEIASLVDALNGAFESLRQAIEREKRFTADAAHELRTPLSVIRTQAEVALRRDREPAAYRQALEQVLAASVRMQRMTEGLLLLARLEQGPSATRERLDLAEVAREAIEASRNGSSDSSVNVYLDAEDHPHVVGNHDQLLMALENLVSNAIRYSNGSARVTVAVKSHPTGATIAVEDSGIGIPADKLPRIFERFYRVDEGRSSARGGAGLGLSIVKAVVESHGGAVSAESAPHEGTTVTIRLPVEAP